MNQGRSYVFFQTISIKVLNAVSKYSSNFVFNFLSDGSITNYFSPQFLSVLDKNVLGGNGGPGY